MIGLRQFVAASLLIVLLESLLFAEKPNIIFMMADDMGMGDTSAYQDFTGNPDDVQIHTPNMERLARMGVRFTDAHTPSSRCTPTRYALLTGRYAWRNRMKHWVLFGAQGDPMIEAGRPTIASMLRDNGYRTAIVGKWHVGLRYRQPSGAPAAGWDDCDLTQSLHTSPLDHGFDFVRITSRSHGTSGPDAGDLGNPKNQSPNRRGPGHIHGRTAVGADNGRELVKSGENAYYLRKLGSRHSNSAIEFLNAHVTQVNTKHRPFFLYYPVNSNHGPYTPDADIDGEPIAGESRTKSGLAMDSRHDFIYENDVALGRLLRWLESTSDPRSPHKQLIENTLVVFTSDNGAEVTSKVATGPFRSNKGSVYEGGHRVPFIIAWKSGGIGDADSVTSGQTNGSLIGLQDLYATLAEIIGSDLPDLTAGNIGAEDSLSFLRVLRGDKIWNRQAPMLFNDHKEAVEDRAASALRYDIAPNNKGQYHQGKWKLFFDAELLRSGIARPYELYNLEEDRREENNLIADPKVKTLLNFLSSQALLHRNSGGHRLASLAGREVTFDWRVGPTNSCAGKFVGESTALVEANDLTMTVRGKGPNGDVAFACDEHGLGLSRGNSDQVESGESLEFSFDSDVIVESAGIVAEDGACGGFYQVDDHAALAIYCVDADNDAQDQHGILSDIGFLEAGKIFRLDSSPHFGVEQKGVWQLRSLTVRTVIHAK